MSLIDSIKDFAFFHAITDAGGEIYAVGGCVRDEIMGRKIKDIDLIIRLIPQEQLIAVLKKCGYTNLVGKSFGVVKFSPKENRELELDIALPRQEISTGEGHRDFEIKFDEKLDISVDLLRRDFTINAIAKNLLTGAIIDPTNGQDDIRKKIINTVFDNAFVEDPLRLMRAVQFAARFNFTLTDKTREEMKKNAEKIMTVAPERIALEIKKLFDAAKPSVGFDLMRDTGLLPLVFPDVAEMIGVTQPQKKGEDVYTHTMKVLDASRTADELEHPGNIDIMLSALFHDAGKPKTRREAETGAVSFYNHQHISTGIAWRWMKEYKITTIGANPQHVCHLVKNHMFETKAFENNEKALRRFINKVGPDNIFDLLDLRLADKKGGRFPNKVYGIVKLREDIRAEINKKQPFTPKDLALNGHDLIALGFAPGPLLGVIQRFLMDKVLDEPEQNTKEMLTKLVLENKEALVKEAPQKRSPREPQ